MYSKKWDIFQAFSQRNIAKTRERKAESGRRFCFSFPLNISKYMGILVLLAAVLALVFPDSLRQIRPTVINYLLGVVMFGMGLTLNLQDFKIVFSRPKDVIIGCLAQFTIMPLLAFGLGKIFGLSDELLVGVVLVGTCPGGTSSNVITYLSGGDTDR